MRKTGTLILVALVAAFLGALPAFGAKAPLSDDDLDGITAAGQPKVIQVEAEADDDVDVDIDFQEEEDVQLALAGTVQTNLNALTLNNTVGENSLANAMNIVAATEAGPITQENIVEQSWGSVKDNEDLSVDGTDASAEAGAGKCIGKNACSATAEGGPPTRASTYADVIIHVDVEADDEVDVDIDVEQDPFFELDLAETVQQTLGALVVNNVVGKNLLANATNIAAGNVPAAAGQVQQASTITGNGGPTSTKQANTVNQFRGSPFGFDTR